MSSDAIATDFAGRLVLVRRREYTSRRDLGLAVALLAPNLLLLLWFTYRPLVQSIRLSTVRWDLVSPRKISVGLDKYRAFWQDPVSRKAILNTLVFSVATVTSIVVLGLLFALTLNRRRFGSRFAGAALFAPFVIPGSAVAVAWYSAS